MFFPKLVFERKPHCLKNFFFLLLSFKHSITCTLNIASSGCRIIPYDNITLDDDELGSGGQETVYKGVFAGQVIAVKKFSKNERIKNIHLLHLDHQNLIQFLLVSTSFTHSQKLLSLFNSIK